MHSRTRQNHRKTQQFFKEAGIFVQPITTKSSLISNDQKVILTKRDKLIVKKKTKQQPLKELGQKVPTENSSTQLSQPFKSDDQLNQPSLLPNQISLSNDFEDEIAKEDFELEKLLRKPNYVKVEFNRQIRGFMGHSSVVFKRPIVEGAFYFQVKMCQTPKEQSTLSANSSVRIGLCPHDYSHAIPLGGKGSICYRSIDGMLIHNKKTQNFGPSFQQGDLVGVEIVIAPPHKYPVKEDTNEGSSVTFYKNGEKVGAYENLKQVFYSVGISIYNEAKIDLRIRKEDIQNIPEGFEAYFESMTKEIVYKELKHSQIFND